jgi:hypothetical protein
MRHVLPFVCLCILTGTGPMLRADLIITPNYLSSITSDPNAATIETTIQSSATDVNDITYNQYVTALKTQQLLSSYDNTAILSLGSGTTTNPVNGSTEVQTSSALQRALGFSAVANPDSTIEFNYSLVYDGTGTPPAGKYSLGSVISHEIDEVLSIGGGGSQLNNLSDTDYNNEIGPLDLYRYSGNGVRSFTTTVSGTNPYFSINGGQTNLVYFNQDGSTGSDFGDWGNGVSGSEAGNTPPLVQDAYGIPGTAPSLSSQELIALDVAGWNLTAQGAAIEAIPEPNTFCLVLASLTGAGIFRRFRRLL